MPSLVGARDTSSFDFGRGGRVNGVATNGAFDPYRDDFARDEMRRDEDDGLRRAVRNGGPSFDRFNTDYLDQNSLSDFRSNEPKFELDHLATFSAGSRNGVIHAEDGLRKLRQMENTTGIWSMRCILIVERHHLVILDNSTGEELEKFPIQLVQEPTAIFKNDRREIYNNLLLFTIIDDPKRRSSQADMHIFQSSRAPAQDIVDEILAAKSGHQRLPLGGEPRIVSPAGAMAVDAPSKAYNFQGMREFIDSRQYQINNMVTETRQLNQAAYSQDKQFGGPMTQHHQAIITRINPLQQRESTEGGSTEVLEKDVQLLNHCFDDIEKFVARLQQAAESYKELEKRKRDRGAKNKKKQSGDGMLNARARPPPDRDFVDIFQKFKLSFNLLAKLKAHIHDPNAPELVHFLFTPLSLIYEASRDPHHGNQNLGDQAMSPVLTGDAKQLLINCLTSKEIELWQALGKNWTTSRDEWQGPIPPYVPEFYDGWQPTASLDELPTRPTVMTQPTIIAAPLPMIEPARVPSMIDVRERGHVLPQRPVPFPDDDGPAAERFHRPDNYNRGYRPNSREFEPRGFDPVNMPSTSRGFEPVAGRSYEASRFEAQSHERLAARSGLDSPFSSDLVDTHNLDRMARQDIPKNITREHLPLGGMSRQEENSAYLSELKRMDDAIIYEVAHDRVGKNAKELTVQRGDIVQVVDNSKNWWKLRNYKGEIGFAPYTILKAVKAEGEHNFNHGQQIPGHYPQEAASDDSYFGQDKGQAYGDVAPDGTNTSVPDRTPGNIPLSQGQINEPAKLYPSLQEVVSPRQSPPMHVQKSAPPIPDMRLRLLSGESFQVKGNPMSSSPTNARTPSPIQELDFILLNNTQSLTFEQPDLHITENSSSAGAQKQISSPFQRTESISPVKGQRSATSDKATPPMPPAGISVKTQAQILSTLGDQDPQRHTSTMQQIREAPLPKQRSLRTPAKRQTSPAAPMPVLATAQTQTPTGILKQDSNRHKTPAHPRRESPSPKPWSPIVSPKPPNSPTFRRRVSPQPKRHVPTATQVRTSPTLNKRDFNRRHSPKHGRRDSSSPKLRGSRVLPKDPAAPTRHGSSTSETTESPTRRRSNPSSPKPRRRRPSSPAPHRRRPTSSRSDKEPPEPPRRGPPAVMSYINAPLARPRTGIKATEEGAKARLHDELKDRFNKPQPGKRSRSRDNKRHLEVTFIDQYSTAQEVTEWLMNKRFSDLVQETYEGYTGADMLRLSLARIEEDLDHEEAVRLHGQITLQKNASGYVSKSTKELKEILRRRKHDCESDSGSSDDDDDV